MTRTTSAAVRTQATSPSNTRTTDPESEFAHTVGRLGDASWTFVESQRGKGGQVGPAQQELWRAYELYRQGDRLTDSPALRGKFLEQLSGLKQWAGARGGLGALTADSVARFRAELAMKHLESLPGGVPGPDDTWMMAALANPRARLDTNESARFQKLQQRASLPQTRGGQVPGGVRRGGDDFVRGGATRTNTPRALQETKAPKRNPEDDVLVIRTPSPTPEDAMADELFAVSQDERTVASVRARAGGTGPIIDGATPKRLRDAYDEYRGTRGLPDTVEYQREFVQMLDARRMYAARNGLKFMHAREEGQFQAESALSRLRARAQAGQSLNLREGEKWMIAALTNPAVSLKPEDAKLLERCNWDNLGLNYNLAAERQKAVVGAARSEAQSRPTPGSPYTAVLNVDTIFEGGTPQETAFTLAARTGGFSEQEIQLAMGHLVGQKEKLFCAYTPQGEQLITSEEQVKAFTRGGQKFTEYQMQPTGALALRDARYALEQGYPSVQAYRDAFNNTLATRFSELGAAYLAAEQGMDKALGRDQNPVLGPLVRGKYDAIREVFLVGSNAIQVGEMFVEEVKLFAKTGNPLVTLNDDPRVVEYFDQETRRVAATYDELGKTYSAQEQNLAAQLARNFVAGTPKMLVSAIPGAGLGYSALKHFHSDFNTFAKEATVDLLSMAGGAVLGQATRGLNALAPRLAPGLINSTLAKTVVKEVVDRGVSAVGGATLEVATSMGPAALEQALGTRNGKPLTAEQKREVSEQLTYKAFERAVWSGLVMGLVVPNRHRKDDFDLLAQDKTSLAGPLYRTQSADNQSRYYASVLVAEPNGKKRVEFLEVSPDSPKVKAALQKQPAKTISQAEADVPLSASRFENRFNDAERKQLVAYANTFAQFQVTSKAVKAADPLEALGDPPPVMKKTETPEVKTPAVPKAPEEKAPATSQFVPLRETPEGVTLDGGTVRVGDRSLEYPTVEFKPTDKGAVGRFKEYLAEKGLKEKSLVQTGEGHSRIVLEHDAFPGKVIKVYSPMKVENYNTRTPYLLQRELALESFLSGLGVRVAKIDRDPELLSRGIVVQEKVKGAPYAELRDTLPAEVRQQADALLERLKERYNIPLFEDHLKRSGKLITTAEGPGKPLTPAGLDLNNNNVWVDTTKQPPELVIIDW